MRRMSCRPIPYDGHQQKTFNRSSAHGRRAAARIKILTGPGAIILGKLTLQGSREFRNASKRGPVCESIPVRANGNQAWPLVCWLRLETLAFASGNQKPGSKARGTSPCFCPSNRSAFLTLEPASYDEQAGGKYSSMRNRATKPLRRH